MVRQAGHAMRRLAKLGPFLLALLAACAVDWALLPREPPSIPYGAWSAPRRTAHPLHHSEADPSPAVLTPRDLLQRDDFEFAMGVGSGLHGLDVFRVDGRGQASYVFANGERWWRAEFQVSPALLARLRQLLVEVDYPSLKRAYYASVCDGTQWCIRVAAGGTARKVYCDNHFPDGARRLARFVGQELLPAHEDDIKEAGRITPAEAGKASSDLW
jgi:hypothetical protein